LNGGKKSEDNQVLRLARRFAQFGVEVDCMSDKIVEVSDETFDTEVAGSDKPVFVDFWAPWCGPCRTVAPIVEDLASQYEGKVKVAKINVDDSPQVAQKFMVTSIPTFILFKKGQAADRTLGAMPKGQFQQFIERNL
jgi:thioredoxin 1